MRLLANDIISDCLKGIDAINIRAWDKRFGRMVEIYGLDFCNGQARIYYDYYQEGCVNWGYLVFMFPLVGKYDKNGKQIYEGDILATSNSNNEYDIWDKEDFGYTVVEYCPEYDGFIGSNWTWDADRDSESVYAMPFIEIIGNKYANPELLMEDNYA